MRLNRDQKIAILKVFRNYLDSGYELFLVGSRTKDHLKGGDIDLLLITDIDSAETLKKLKFQIINQIKKQKSIDETRVDLTIGTPKDLKKDAFIATLNEGKIKLN